MGVVSSLTLYLLANALFSIYTCQSTLIFSGRYNIIAILVFSFCAYHVDVLASMALIMYSLNPSINRTVLPTTKSSGGCTLNHNSISLASLVSRATFFAVLSL